jgi:hypothetical protein
MKTLLFLNIKKTGIPLFILMLLLLSLPAQAATYTFPGFLPAGCVNNGGGSYHCGALTLAAGDTVTIASFTPVTITTSGAFGTGAGVLFNVAGITSDLTLVVNGAVTLGAGSLLNANVQTLGAGAVTLGADSWISGNVSTETGFVLIGAATIPPPAPPTPQQTGVGGNVSTITGYVSMGADSVINGSVTTQSAGYVVLGANAKIVGSIATLGAGYVTLGAGAQVSSSIAASGTTGADYVSTGVGAVVGCGISTAGSHIVLGASTQVSGNLSTKIGYITVGATSTVGGQISMNDPAPSYIGIGAGSKVYGVCCDGSGASCVTDGSGITPSPLVCVVPSGSTGSQCAKSAFDHFNISGAGAASTCAPQTLTLSARDSNNNVLSSYTGSAALSTSSGRGNWQVGSNLVPAGVLSPGAANSGRASYSFAAADQGVVALSLSHSLAQNVSLTISDLASPASSSGLLQFRDNAFVWAEDLANRISGSGVAVAGRPHDLQVALIKKDPSSGSCGIATDYSGNRNLKLWRTDTGGPWPAPALLAPALSLPAARPSANNLGLSFNAGVASLTLTSSDIGKYSLTLEDDSLVDAATAVLGSLSDLTVRPFTLLLSNLNFAGTANPNGSTASDARFGVAGGNFSATLAAYRWSSAADSNNDGMPDANATLAQTSAGGLTASFSSASTLTPLSGSQTPASDVLGQLLNGTLSSFTGGSATVANLRYSEVGSFVLNGSGWVSNFLGSAGVNLDGLVFNASGAQNARIGRFVPADFALSAGSVINRVAANCLPASGFSYLDENFALRFTLTARNALGTTTLNYSGDFAKLDPATAGNFQLAGIQGSTVFSTSAQASGPARLALGSSSGSWVQGVAADINLPTQALRGTTPDGPFDNTAFGIAPLDSDGVALTASLFDLDIDSAAGADHARVANLNLRYGRMRLQNAIGSQDRALKLPLLAQYWTASGYLTNTLDSCSRITAAQLSFGNFRKTLSAADISIGAGGSGLTLNQGRASLTLAKPGSGQRGSVDVAISLGSTAADASGLQPWTPARPASAGAKLSFLRANWCGVSSSADPSARSTFGLYRRSDALLFQRENF